MTISSLLGRGDAPVSRFQMAGQSAMGDPEVFHVDRGSYSHSHGGGGKGGIKGSQSALSALTLLAFLFFLNLLQSCLKDSMMMNGSTMLMMMAANRSARHTRSLQEAIESEAAEINALPGPGVHWDSNVLVRQKGDLGNEEFSLDQNPPENDHTLYTNDGEIETSLWKESIDESNIEDVDYDDYQEQNTNSSLPKSSNSQNKDLSSGQLSKNKTKYLHEELSTLQQEWSTQEESPIVNLKNMIHSASTGSSSTQSMNNLLHKELELSKQERSNDKDSSNVKAKSAEDSASSQYTATQNADFFLHKELDVSKEERPYQQESPQSLNIDGRGATTENLKDNRYYQYYSNSEFMNNDDDWDYYAENDKSEDFVRRDFSTSNPTADGFVKDRYETEDTEDGSIVTSVGEYISRILTSVSNPVMERLRTSFNIAQCSELVVCEAHRLGRAWGTPGLLLASGFREVILWMYGNDDGHRKLIMEAAATGRERHSCSAQMQQCEDKSKDRSALPFMATLLEHLV